MTDCALNFELRRTIIPNYWHLMRDRSRSARKWRSREIRANCKKLAKLKWQLAYGFFKTPDVRLAAESDVMAIGAVITMLKKMNKIKKLDFTT